MLADGSRRRCRRIMHGGRRQSKGLSHGSGMGRVGKGSSLCSVKNARRCIPIKSGMQWTTQKGSIAMHDKRVINVINAENVPAVHSIADVCSMKEKNHAIGHDRIAT